MMMSPQDVLQAAGQRVIVPRTGGVVGQRSEGGRTSRDDRRRTSHNEGVDRAFVERLCV